MYNDSILYAVSTVYVTSTRYVDSTLDDVEVLASCLSTSDVQGTARVQYPRLRVLSTDHVCILYVVSTLYVRSTPYFDRTLDDGRYVKVLASY